MQLHEDQRMGANLSFGGLGLLLMLVLSLIGLSAMAGRILSPERSLTHATPSTISVESTHYTHHLP